MNVPPKTTKPSLALALILASGLAWADDPKKPKADAVNRVEGVKQEAVESARKVDPPSIDPTAVTTPKGVDQVDGVDSIQGVPVSGQKSPTPPPPPAGTAEEGINPTDGVNTINGVTAPGPGVPTPETPEPAPAGNAAEGVNQVEGIQAMPTNAVLPVPPPPAGAVSTIQAVRGVQGIIAPRQQNLEAALQINQATEGTPAGADPAKGAAAAAALLSAPAGLLPGPAPGGDGRDAFQQFEEQKTPGS